MVGASLATAFASSPYLGHKKVYLLEAAPAPKSEMNPKKSAKDEFSNRVSALNSASKEFLEGIGAWKGISDTGRYHGFNRMFVWDELSAPSIEFKGDPDLNDGYIGHLVENDITVNALTNCLSTLNNNFNYFTQILIWLLM